MHWHFQGNFSESKQKNGILKNESIKTLWILIHDNLSKMIG